MSGIIQRRSVWELNNRLFQEPSMRVAIILARAGSKRIADKNIRLFLGKPVIAYSIAAAQSAKVFDKVIVSTDDPAIAAIARKFGAEAPFLRPAKLADDSTSTIPVVKHAIDWLNAKVATVEHVCGVYAAAPLIRANDLRRGFEKLTETGAEFAFPVTSFPFPIFRALRIENQQLKMFWPEHELARSQDLPEAFHDAGQFYWGTADAFRTKTTIYSSRSIPILLPRHMVQDIDTTEDWQRAELMYRLLNESDTITCLPATDSTTRTMMSAIGTEDAH